MLGKDSLLLKRLKKSWVLLLAQLFFSPAIPSLSTNTLKQNGKDNFKNHASLLEFFSTYQIETAVHPATIAFHYPKEKGALLSQSIAYLKGNLSRIADWQKPEQMYDFLASQMSLESQAISPPAKLLADSRFATLRFYRIPSQGQKNDLICTYAIRKQRELDGSRVLLELCLLPTDNSLVWEKLAEILDLFAKEKNFPPLFSAPLILFPPDTLSLPALFLPLKSQNNYSYLQDSAGVAQVEIFREPLSQLTKDPLALKIYESSLTEILAKQGNWDKLGNTLTLENSHCLLFYNRQKYRLSYCYTTLNSSQEKQWQRLSFLIIFPEELYDSQNLQKWQLEVLNSWQKQTR